MSIENGNADSFSIVSINEKYKDLADKIQKAERRHNTLSQHIAQYAVRNPRTAQGAGH